MRTARKLSPEQQAELSRIAIWPLTPKAVRAVILMIAGLPRERCTENLDSFTPHERHCIWKAAQGLHTDAGVIAQCTLPTVAGVLH